MYAKTLSLPQNFQPKITNSRSLVVLIQLEIIKDISSFNCRTKYFMNSFFPDDINQWNKLDIKITNITSHNTFKKSLLSVI